MFCSLYSKGAQVLRRFDRQQIIKKVINEKGGACLTGKGCHLLRGYDVNLNASNATNIEQAKITIVCTATRGQSIKPVQCKNPSYCPKLQRFKKNQCKVRQ